MEKTILTLNGLSKFFPGVKALDGVSFSLREGEVLALLGENGAGKSTLIKCLTGANVPTSGTIELFGKEYSSLSPAIARRHGISAVYQEFNLVPNLPIVENVFMGNNPGNGFVVDYKQMLKRSSDMFEYFGIHLNPKADVSTLSPAMMQIVEITKAVMLDCRILILDEPTAPLTSRETEILFKIIADLKSRGVSILYISHRLEEIFEICDRAVILRDGRMVGESSMSNITRKDLIRMMIGRELTSYYPERQGHPTDEVVLRVENLTGNGDRDVSFDAHKGEILGVAGLVGAGRTELMNVIFCDVPKDSGRILINGCEIYSKHPRQMIDNGVSYLPEDRKTRGLLLKSGISFNMTLASIKKFCRFGIVDRKAEFEEVDALSKKLEIKTPSYKKEVQYLSGGNQQKVIVAKWLTTDSNIIIFDEPTRGIDVGSKHEIYEIIVDLADEGKTIVMVSSEFEELIGIADRIVVMSEGRLVGNVERKDFDKEYLLDLASGDK